MHRLWALTVQSESYPAQPSLVPPLPLPVGLQGVFLLLSNERNHWQAPQRMLGMGCGHNGTLSAQNHRPRLSVEGCSLDGHVL